MVKRNRVHVSVCRQMSFMILSMILIERFRQISAFTRPRASSCCSTKSLSPSASHPHRCKLGATEKRTSTLFMTADKDGEGKVTPHGSLIFEALMSGDIAGVEEYVAAGGDCSVQDSLGDTPLMLAVENEMGSILSYLVRDGGADVNKASARSGETPLHVAAYYGYPHLAKILVGECGADIESRTKKGDTALGLACFWGNVECVKYLLHAGADPDKVNDADKRPGDEFDAVFVPAATAQGRDEGGSRASGVREGIVAMLEEARAARKAVLEATAAASSEGHP